MRVFAIRNNSSHLIQLWKNNSCCAVGTSWQGLEKLRVFRRLYLGVMSVVTKMGENLTVSVRIGMNL